MKYQGRVNFNHDEQPKTGVLLVNLGTPEAPTTPALRKYLAEFLSDPRVVEFPRLLWKIILHGVILRIRPPRSAKAYQSVWMEQGSPLKVHTAAQRDKLQQRLENEPGQRVVVEYAMRYGTPQISQTIERMMEQGVRRLLVVPMYPQYSGSTTASVFDAIAADFQQRRWLPELRFLTHYHDYPPYIAAVAEKIKAYQATHGKAEKLLFSYHGVPKRYLDQGDPYHCECYKTTRLVAEYLGLTENEYMTTFQSRFGREEWLKPYTDETLKSLARDGVKSVQMVCPGFAADCLETIEEIGEENREYFLEAGGQSYQYIECLNDDAEHIEMLAGLVLEHTQGWHPAGSSSAQSTVARACALGAEQ